jgi:hypothetical protein
LGVTKKTKCWCFYGWVCEEHPDKAWRHDQCVAAGDLCKNPQCKKIPDTIFLSVHYRVQPGKRKPPVRKTVLPNKVSSFVRGKPISVSADSVRKKKDNIFPVEETYQAGSEKY